LTWQEIRSVDWGLIDFGSHTLNHPRLDQLDGLTLENEICSSKHILEDQLGHPVSSFCYPYGRISMKAKALVQSAYQAACCTRTGLVSEHSDQYQLERVEIKYLSPTFIFTGIDQPWLKPYLMVRRGIRSAASAVFNRQWN
jgi:peptidoglycan/xylan/chitin deacetylase (PgdA/CDA1 family)